MRCDDIPVLVPVLYSSDWYSTSAVLVQCTRKLVQWHSLQYRFIPVYRTRYEYRYTVLIQYRYCAALIYKYSTYSQYVPIDCIDIRVLSSGTRTRGPQHTYSMRILATRTVQVLVQYDVG